MAWIMGGLSLVCGIGFGLLAMPVIAPSAARRQVEKINPDLLPTKVVCPLSPLPAMPPPLMPEYAPRPTRATGVRKSPNTEKLMAVWWQAKIDSVARAPLHLRLLTMPYNGARLRAMPQRLGRRVTCCRRSSGVRLIRVLKMVRTATRAKARTMNCSGRRLLRFLFRTSPDSLAMLRLASSPDY